MANYLDIAIVVLFLLANLVIGLFSSRGIRSLHQFSVGNRNFGTFPILATLSASFIGGGYTMGNAGKVYDGGMVFAVALLGFSLKEVLVGSLVAPRMDRFRDCISVGDIMARHYGTFARVTTGMFAMVVCAGILGAQVGALSAIFSAFFQMGGIFSTLASFLIIILYCTIGGMRAVVYTDILQFIVLVLGLPLVFIMGVYSAGGLAIIAQRVPVSHLNLVPGSPGLPVFISMFVTFMLGETLVPPYAQRLFMASSANKTRNATVLSGLLSIPFFLVVGASGLVAYALNPDLPADQSLPWLVANVLPVGITGFVISALVAVIMSSAAGFLNAASVSFVNDVMKPIAGERLDQRQLLRLAKFATVFVGVCSVGFSLYSSNMLDVLIYAYNFWAPIVLIPLLAVFFDIPARPVDFVLGASAGILGMCICSIAGGAQPVLSPVVAGVAGNLVSFYLSRRLGAKSW